MIELLIGLPILAFSLYSFFIANDALRLGMGLLRVILSVLGLIALRFDQDSVLTAAVLMYAMVSLLLLAMTRSEVQQKND